MRRRRRQPVQDCRHHQPVSTCARRVRWLQPAPPPLLGILAPGVKPERGHQSQRLLEKGSETIWFWRLDMPRVNRGSWGGPQNKWVSFNWFFSICWYFKFESGLSLSVTLTIFKWDESVTQLCKVDLFLALSSAIIIHRKSSSLQFIETMWDKLTTGKALIRNFHRKGSHKKVDFSSAEMPSRAKRCSIGR